jgi:hypothetical protein
MSDATKRILAAVQNNDAEALDAALTAWMAADLEAAGENNGRRYATETESD